MLSLANRRALIAVFAALHLAVANAAEDGAIARGDKDLAGIVEFVKKNVVGKTVIRETTSKIDAGRVEAVFRRELCFSRLDVSDQDVRLQLIATIKQTNYDLDDQGRRPADAVGRNEDRVVVVEIRIGRSLSTGEVRGYRIGIANSIKGPWGAPHATAVRAALKNQSLVFDYSDIGYGDGFSKGGTSRAIVSEETWTLQLVDGKLELVEDDTTYPFDPSNGTRGPGEKSHRVSREE